jgi:DNA (cytosine-5)-methyltransferase 1
MRTVELFAGIGGLGLGLKEAGFQILTGYEHWDKALDVWEHNAKTPAFKLDLGDVAAAALHISVANPDAIVGGPPCQDFSALGKGVLGKNAAMTQAYAMIIAVVRPEWFVFENTRRAPLSLNYRQARAIWKRAGYGLTEVLLDASYYGVPQARMRFITIGRLGEIDGFLESAIRDAASKKPTVVRSILDPDKYPDDAEMIERTGYFVRPYTGGKGVHRLDRPAPTVIRTTTDKPPPGYKNNPHPTDHIKVEVAWRLKPHQAMRIQGFPGDFEVVGRRRLAKGKDSYADRDTMQMIANAVPPPLAKAIGEVILQRAGGYSIPALHPGFDEFLLKKFPPRQDPEAKVEKPKKAVKGKKPEKPKLSANISNIKSRLNRARRLLHGRTFSDLALELAALEDSVAFAALDVRTKSDLRAALRLHHEFVATLPESKFARKQPKVSVREQWGVGRRPSVMVPTIEAASSTTPAATGPSVLRRRRPVPDAPVPEGDPYLHADMRTYDPRHEPSATTLDSYDEDNG